MKKTARTDTTPPVMARNPHDHLQSCIWIIQALIKGPRKMPVAKAMWKYIIQCPRCSKKNMSATTLGTVASAAAAAKPATIRPPSKLFHDRACILQAFAATNKARARRYTGLLPSTLIMGTKRILPSPNVRTLNPTKKVEWVKSVWK